jgi:hypothetical protein
MEFYMPKIDGETLVSPIYLPEDFRAPFVDPLTATCQSVLEIFFDSERYAGQSLSVIGNVISPRHMVETFNRVTGKKAEYGLPIRGKISFVIFRNLVPMKIWYES